MNFLMVTFGIGILGVGLIAAYVVATLIRDRYLIQSWDTVPARITKSEFEAYDDGEDDMYRAVIEYNYSVQNVPYHGNEFAKNEVTSSNVKRMALARVEKYPVGKKVDVVYNPDDHSEAYLERTGSLLAPIVFGIFSAIFLTFGSITLALGLGIVG